MKMTLHRFNIYSKGMFLVLASMSLGLLLPATQTLGDIFVTEKGLPKATIVEPLGASEVVHFAATELQKYVHKISDAKLPIRSGMTDLDSAAIVLRRANLDPPRHGLQCDSFTIKSEGDRLFLTGNNDRAVLYAVYAFLESLGAMWLEPGEAGEIVPHMPTITVSDLNLAFKPAFDLRGVCLYDQGEGRETVDWMGKMRMNLILHPNEAKACEKRGILVMEGTMHGFAERMGLGPEWHKDPANHQYLAMVNGKRGRPWKNAPQNVEPCLSNEGAVEKLIATSLEFIESYRPSIYLFDPRADDNKNNWCECEECSKHTSTDKHIEFVNRLARIIHEKWPNKKVSLIAYYDTMSPPKEIFPDLSMGNMILWFAPITRTYQDPIQSATKEKVETQFPRNKAIWPKTDGAWLPFLREWQDAFSGPILMLDYYHWSGNNNKRSGYFYVRPDVIAADLRFYKKLGLSGSIGVEPCPFKIPNGWNLYLKAQLLWDPTQDVAELKRRYDQAFYGCSAELAQKYIRAIAEVINLESNDTESIEKLRDLAIAFDTDMKSCEKSPLLAERLNRISLWVNYVALRKSYYSLARGNAAAVEEAAMKLVDFLEANRDEISSCYNNVDDMIPIQIKNRQRKAAKEKEGKGQPAKARNR